MKNERLKYRQCDYHFNELDDLNPSWTLEQYGCGPTAIANVLINFGYNFSPIDIARKILLDKDGQLKRTFLRNRGISSNGIIYCLDQLITNDKIPICYEIIKIDFSNPAKHKRKIIKLIQNGNMAIIHVEPSDNSPLTFSKHGHYLVISDVDEHDRFFVINSNKAGDHQVGIPFDYDTIIQNMIGRKESFNFLIIKKKRNC